MSWQVDLYRKRDGRRIPIGSARTLNDISTLTMQAIRNPMVNWAGEDYDIERANKNGRDVWSTFFGKWVRREA